MVVTGRFVALLAVAVVPTVLLDSGWGALAWIGVLVVAAAVDVALAADLLAVRVERRLPRAIRRGAHADGVLVLTNGGARRLRGQARDLWEPSAVVSPRRAPLDVPPGERQRVQLRLEPFRRGRRRTAGVAVRAVGPLGLAGRQRVVPAPEDLVVTPPFLARRHLASRLVRLRELDGESTVQLRGHGTEFDSLRDYVRGDDVRSIDWRATARRQDLVVRTWRPERDRRVVVVVDTGRASAARIGDEPRLDTFIESALLVAALAAAAGDRVDLVVLDDAVRGRVHGATRADVLQRFGEVLAEAVPTLAATDFAGLSGVLDGITTSRAFVVIATTLDSLGASADVLTALPAITRRHTVVVSAITDPAVVAMAAPTVPAVRRPTPNGQQARPTHVDREARPTRSAPVATRPAPVATRLRWAAAGLQTGTTPRQQQQQTDVYRRAAAERTLLDADGVVEAARRLGAEVVVGEPEAVPPMLADAYLRAKATGRL
ncbi:DUF58 domain-containing protein [Curtobacterium sp. Leaf261]|uniref:DUF58 domain-containing protein n=1 Tax=Curtobacterium sp. Leaf261 TaxID=1736311 RepID=UPI0006FE9B1A|nr:DUF58 domain-containing protein [Curtobacterium sp. Leaf261]KQO62145.1 hypothetical protein ASF23_09940 [Curtobacterium sp. Leaf261]